MMVRQAISQIASTRRCTLMSRRKGQYFLASCVFTLHLFRKKAPEVRAKIRKFMAGANGVCLSRAREGNFHLLDDAARSRPEHQNAIREIDGLIHIVRDEKRRL